MIYDTLNRATAATAFVSRLRNVMKGKYSIRDKFVVIASILNAAAADIDINRFGELKRERDGIHEMAPGHSGYSVAPTQDLLRKYLRLHLLSEAEHRGGAP